MEYPKPEPRKPKPKTRIAPMSAKRRAAEQEKKAAYKNIGQKACQGCGTRQNLSRSHTLPVSRNLSAIGDERNIWILCMGGCHELCESSRFYALDCGEEIVSNMLEIDYQAGLARIAKMRDRLVDDEINPDDLPYWVIEDLRLLK